MADRTDFHVMDYIDRTNGATRYLAHCTHEKTTELRGYECREHAEAAARKWISDRLRRNGIPVPVAPKSEGSDSFEKGISACIGLTNALLIFALVAFNGHANLVTEMTIATLCSNRKLSV